MDPANFVNSVTGIVAIVMIFGVPIIAIIATMAIVMAVVGRRHKERMKMIEQGMMPPPPRKQKGNYYGLMITGAIFFAFGLAMFAAALAGQESDYTPGFIFGFVGLAMLACFAIIRVVRKNEPADNNGAYPPAPAPPPPPLPPQP
jgi:hypothetical protein